VGFEAAGVIWHLAAVRRRLRRGEAGPGLQREQEQPATPS
jgi:hypothetical protein